MKRYLIGLAAASLLLSGCSSWMDGSHVTVTDHQEQSTNVQSSAYNASTYDELVDVLIQLVESGTESAVINMAEYDQETLEMGIARAGNHVCFEFPLGTYAVEDMEFQIGSGGGQPAVSVEISYIHGRSEIRQIQRVADMEAAKEKLRETLKSCGESLVLIIEDYEQADLVQMAADYAAAYPEIVMETPEVAVGVYPETGSSRVVELKFTYQTSRDVLRQMRSQVQRVFLSAAYYIDRDSSELEKFAQLYSFLMDREDYTIETSITPSYSLLIHGVGDSRAMAMAYAAMCRQASLECQVVTGTREGESRCWNLVRCDGEYYHLDLLQCDERGEFRLLTDEEMTGYVWDYSAYPAA